MKWRHWMALAWIWVVPACDTLPHMPADPQAANAAQIHAQLGARYADQGRYELALQKLQRALQLDPNLGSAHHAIAVVYQRLDRDAEAEEHFKRAIALERRNWAARADYGAFLCSQERYGEADKVFRDGIEKARRSGGRDAVYLFTLAGICAQRDGRLADAERYLRSALDLNPNYAPALLEMARLAYQKQDYLAARGFLARYRAGARHTPESLALGIRIEQALGDADAVASYQLLLRSQFPDSEQARELTGTRHER